MVTGSSFHKVFLERSGEKDGEEDDNLIHKSLFYMKYKEEIF